MVSEDTGDAHVILRNFKILLIPREVYVSVAYGLDHRTRLEAAPLGARVKHPLTIGLGSPSQTSQPALGHV